MKRYATSSRPARKGITLVELLSVILCVVLLVFLAIPLCVSAGARSGKPSCSAGMANFNNAVCTYSVVPASTHRQLAQWRP